MTSDRRYFRGDRPVSRWATKRDIYGALSPQPSGVFANYGRSTKEERASILRRLHTAASARIDDLTAAMVEEYGGVVQFARPIVESGVNAFLGLGDSGSKSCQLQEAGARRRSPWNRSAWLA